MGNFKRIPDFFSSKRGITRANYQQNPDSSCWGLFGNTFVISIKGIDLVAFAKSQDTTAQDSDIGIRLINTEKTNEYKIGDSVNWIDKKNNLRYGKICHINYDEAGGVMNVQLHDEEMFLRTIAYTQIKNKIKNNGEPDVPTYRDSIFNNGNGLLGMIGNNTTDYKRNS